MENHCRVLKDKMNVSKADGILNLRKSMNFFFFFFLRLNRYKVPDAYLRRLWSLWGFL